MNVGDVFCQDLSSVSGHMTIKTVIRLMLLTRSPALPIVNQDNQYVGCIEISDIIDACIPAYMKSFIRTGFLPDIDTFYQNLSKLQDKQVVEYMPKDYPRLRPEDNIHFAADLLEKTRRQVIPVVEKDRLLGTLSRLEIISAILKNELTPF